MGCLRGLDRVRLEQRLRQNGNVLRRSARIWNGQLIFEQTAHVHLDRFVHIACDLLAGLAGGDTPGYSHGISNQLTYSP